MEQQRLFSRAYIYASCILWLETVRVLWQSTNVGGVKSSHSFPAVSLSHTVQKTRARNLPRLFTRPVTPAVQNLHELSLLPISRDKDAGHCEKYLSHHTLIYNLSRRFYILWMKEPLKLDESNRAFMSVSKITRVSVTEKYPVLIDIFDAS